MRDFLLLVGLCVLAGWLGTVQTKSRKAGSQDALGRSSMAIVNPVARSVAGTANGIGDFFHGITHASALVEENRRLKESSAVAALYTQTLDILDQEIDSLRKLQAFPDVPGKSKIPAEIVSYFGYESRITLDAGSSQGVQVGQPVVAGDGLVGVIQTVQQHSSQALLVTSPVLKIGAMAARNPPSAGLIHGEKESTLTLELQDPNAPVKIGDLVFTSGFSEFIPRNIPIGRVVQVEDNEEFGSRQATVFPSVSIGSVREVYILK